MLISYILLLPCSYSPCNTGMKLRSVWWWTNRGTNGFARCVL